MERFLGAKKIVTQTKQKAEKKRGRRTNQSTRNPKLDTVKWDIRARCDIKLLWQITMGDGMDIFQNEQVGLFSNTWTPTEEDMKLLSSKVPDDKCSDKVSDPSKIRARHPESKDKCGKYCCFFDEGSFLYL
ncbi:hypothetical protein AC249_AIPGENE23764 [Exaiptasia diaphana]|nr:hypothetical protein AC249_AIPGENE23764 [Exaiptasia diaphana]